MATLDFTQATSYLDMRASDLVAFDTVEEAVPTVWSFFTPAGNDLDLRGQGMTFDAQGHAQSGTVTSIAIDVGNDDFDHPDLLITGINVAAATLDDGAGTFWRFLEGDDTFVLPSAPGTADLSIFGDASRLYAGLVQGGNDAIYVNGAFAYVAGDVSSMVGSQFQGGADKIHGSATNAQQILAGDVASLSGGGKLAGGNDNIFIQSTSDMSWAVGDADLVYGTGSGNGRSEVVGGNDYIAARAGSKATLVGDVYGQGGYSLVRGGNDEIVGADQGELIAGDVLYVGIDRMVGGDDTIWGNDGGDAIAGDAYGVESAGKVVGGNDTIYGGDGDDRIFGDVAEGSPASVTGGNDELHGDEGDDVLFGGGGDDVLLGGAGVDYMIGGAGNDVYVIDSDSDIVDEAADQGTDIVKALIEEVVLADNVENLSSLWSGDFVATGNALANTMSAGGGDDYLSGKAGGDTLIGLGGKDKLSGNEGVDLLVGGAGADILDGGDGIDTASYAGATEGVKAALDGSLAGEGDALGDTFTSVERMVGSDYRDVLRGDANANMLTGGAGNDVLQGGGGNDVLIGGAGKDQLSGGTGNDRFDFLALIDAVDTVADFGNAAGNNDSLRFDGYAFGGLPAGALAANRFVANAAGVATTLDQRFVYETDTGILRYDSNGSAAGGVTAIATFTGAPTLTASDFSIA